MGCGSRMLARSGRPTRSSSLFTSARYRLAQRARSADAALHALWRSALRAERLEFRGEPIATLDGATHAGLHFKLPAPIETVIKANVERMVLVSGNISGTGNALNNTLIGNGGANTLKGSSGDDKLLAGAGNDVGYGDLDVDTLLGQDPHRRRQQRA